MEIVESTSLTDVGRRMAHNEDAVLALREVPLFVVADGTGGVAPARTSLEVLGRYADALAARGARVAATPDTSTRLAVGRFFEHVLSDAGRRIRADAEARRAPGEAASLVAVTLMGRFAYVAHVGNARAYLFRDGRLRCLTVDHTLAMQQLRRGEITIKEFATSRYRKTLTQALGASPNLSPDVAEIQLAPGDVVLLCSDGLHRPVPDRVIAASLAAAPDLTAAAADLVARANEAGGKDNVSVALLRLGSPGAAQGAVAAIDVARALGEVFLFKDLSDAERLLVAPYFEHRRFEAGDVLCREGDEGDSFFVMVGGRVEVTHGSARLIELGAGSYAGEISLARRGPRTATLTARSPTEALVLSRDRFLELVRRRPRLGARLVMPLLSSVGERIVDLRERLHTVGRVLSG